MTGDDPLSDDEVVAAVKGLRGNVTALEVCKVLEQKHPRRACQLAIQRAIERGKVCQRKDWSLCLPDAHFCELAS